MSDCRRRAISPPSRRQHEHGPARAQAATRRGAARVSPRARHHRRRHPDDGAVVVQARELVRLARKHGYRTDELIKIIESVD